MMGSECLIITFQSNISKFTRLELACLNTSITTHHRFQCYSFGLASITIASPCCVKITKSYLIIRVAYVNQERVDIAEIANLSSKALFTIQSEVKQNCIRYQCFFTARLRVISRKETITSPWSFSIFEVFHVTFKQCKHPLLIFEVQMLSSLHPFENALLARKMNREQMKDQNMSNAPKHSCEQWRMLATGELTR